MFASAGEWVLHSKSPIELISASGQDTGEKARRERLLHHLESTNEAEPIELAKHSLDKALILPPDVVASH
jgi:hypothetical protein